MIFQIFFPYSNGSRPDALSPSICPFKKRWAPRYNPLSITNRLALQFACILLFIATTVLSAGSTPWKFIAVGDTRGDGVPINTTILSEIANEIVRQGATFVIVPGDLVNSGSSANFQSWKSLMGPVYQAGIGVYPVLGNHDDNDVSGFIAAFGADIPDNGPAGEIDRTYAIEHDNVLVLALDTYVNVNIGRVNQAWVDATLNANTRPHVFAFGHMPAFKANHTDCLDDNPTQRNTFWNSLKNAGATVYFCGHDHFYDHMRVDDGDGNPDNDVHQMIVGGGGAPLYDSYTYNGSNAPWTPINLFHENQFGYTLVEVDGNIITMTSYHRTPSNTYLSTDVWTYTIGTPPAPPTGLTSAPGDAQVALSWTASDSATGYNVKRATAGPGGPYTTIASGVTATSYTDHAVTNGATYYYVVTAVNAAGESGNSAAVSATPQAPPAPGPFTLTARTGSKAGQIKLTWTKSSGATSYDVKRATMTGGPYTTVKTGVTTTNYTDSGLTRGKIYYYVITARNAGGQRDSNQASAKAK